MLVAAMRSAAEVATDPPTRMLSARISKVQYQIQYLDSSANIIRELSADARSGMSAFELVADLPWAPRAVTMRVLDANGHEGSFRNQRRDQKDRTLNRAGMMLVYCRTLASSAPRRCQATVRSERPRSLRSKGRRGPSSDTGRLSGLSGRRPRLLAIHTPWDLYQFATLPQTSNAVGVEVWRGGFRLSMSVCRPFRLAVPYWLSRGSVSTLPSSNRTGRFPASGSRTRPHAFVHGTSRPSRLRRTSPKCP